LLDRFSGVLENFRGSKKISVLIIDKITNNLQKLINI